MAKVESKRVKYNKETELTINDMVNEIGRSRSTLEHIIKYLKISFREEIKGKITTKIYPRDCLSKIQTFLKENPDTKSFFRKITCIEKYGFEHFSSAPEIKEKKRLTELEHFGGHHMKLQSYKDALTLVGKERSEEIKEKREKTNLEKYGYTNPMKNKSVSQKMKDTNLKRYGNECSLHGSNQAKTEQIFIDKYNAPSPLQNEKVKEKIRETNLERYGVEYITQNKDIKTKIQETKLERYNDKNYNNRDKAKQTMLKRFGDDYIKDIASLSKEGIIQKYGSLEGFGKYLTDNRKIKFDDWGRYLKEKFSPNRSEINQKIKDGQLNHYKTDNHYCTISELSKELNINPTTIYDRLSSIVDYDGWNLTKENVDLAKEFFKDGVEENVSFAEKEIVSFIKSIYNGTIEENNRIIISPKELDIYIPEKKIAIEFDGLYWHSDKFRDKFYHLDKTLSCLDRGIRLIHIFEDDWNNRKTLVKKLINTSINGYEKTIDFKDISIKEISSDVANIFLSDEYLGEFSHLDEIKNIGLYMEDTLVGILGLAVSDKRGEIIYNSLLPTIRISDYEKKITSYIKNTYAVETLILYLDNSFENLLEYKDFPIKLESPTFKYLYNGSRVSSPEGINNPKKIYNCGYSAITL